MLMKAFRGGLIAALLFLPTLAFAQGAILQSGPATPGHPLAFVQNGIAMDPGPASGAQVGQGVSELLLAARGTGTPPYAAQGTGPYGTNLCDYDGPITSAYHYICFSANAQGAALLAVGSGGGAAAQGLKFIVDGATYTFPFGGSGGTGDVTGPSSSVNNGVVLFNGTSGKVIKDSVATTGTMGNLISTNTTVQILENSNPILAEMPDWDSVFVGTTNLPTPASTASPTECGSFNGQRNVGVGQSVMRSLTSACNDTGMGFGALAAVTTGSLNSAFGSQALNDYNSSDGSGENSAFGYAAGSSLVGSAGDARYNTMLGTVCMTAATSGTFNVCIGSHAMLNAVFPNSVVAIGYDALPAAGSPDSATCVGAISCFDFTGSDITALGWSAQRNNVNTAGTVAIGHSSFYQNTAPVDGVAVGYRAASGAPGYSNTGATIIGALAGLALNTGSDHSTFVGSHSGFATTTASNNAAFGAFSLYQNVTGADNTALGDQAMIGGSSYSVSRNVVIGGRAAASIATGGDKNVVIGFFAGNGLTTGSQNILIGNAGDSSASYNQVTTGVLNIAIGSNNALASPTANGQLVIGNYIYGTGLTSTGTTISGGSIGIGIKAPAANLDVAGTFNASGAVTLGSTLGVTGTSSLAAVTATTVTGTAIAGTTLNLSAAAPTVAAAHIGYGATTAAAANCNVASPTPTGCIVVNVAGTTRYIPYY